MFCKVGKKYWIHYQKVDFQAFFCTKRIQVVWFRSAVILSS